MVSSNPICGQQSPAAKPISTTSPYIIYTPILSPLFGLGFWPSLASPKGDMDCPRYVPYEGSFVSEDLMGLGISYNSMDPPSIPDNVPSRHRHKLSWTSVLVECDAENGPPYALKDSTQNSIRSFAKSGVLLRRAVYSDSESARPFHEASSSMEAEHGSDVKHGAQERFARIPLCVVTEHAETAPRPLPLRTRSPLLMVCQKNFALKCPLSPELLCDVSEMPLPVVDINMRQLSMMRQSQSLGINPANLNLSSSGVPSVDSPFTLCANIPYRPSTLGPPEINNISANEIIVKSDPAIAEDNAFLQLKSPSSRTFRSLTNPVQVGVHPRRIKRRAIHQDETSDSEDKSYDTTSSPDFMPCNRSVQKKSAKEKGSSASHPVQMGTPVTNAHSGISLQDLRSRAERFRSKNPGCEYVGEWLLLFAGKLSRSGRPLRDYRCYVIGCDQINKRKDHMITHIGGHLDQRLFQCSHCPSRFLRKNELKRHELGHTGLRPFACHMCCLKRSTFVRRDLLLRHIKRMHKDEANATKGKSHAVKKVKTK